MIVLLAIVLALVVALLLVPAIGTPLAILVALCTFVVLAGADGGPWGRW